MTTLLEQVNALEIALGDAQTTSWGLCGALTLLVYDICLFLPEEVRAIWNAKWTWGKALYIVFRYGTLCDIFALFINTSIKDPSISFCEFFTRFQLWAAIISFWSMEVIQALRTAAIFGEVKIVKRGIYVYCAFQNIFLLYITIELSTSATFDQASIKGVTCSFTEMLSRRDLVALQAVGLVYEVILWILGSVRISQIALGGHSKFAWLLFKDTVIYFPINSVLSLATFLTFLLLPVERGLLLLLVDGLWIVFMSIAITRMVFHLREYLSVSSSATARRRANLDTMDCPRSLDQGIISTAFAFKTVDLEMGGYMEEDRSENDHDVQSTT